MILFAGALGAFLVATILGGLLSLSGPVDRPRERGMHLDPTPTAGGLAIIAATAFSALIYLHYLRLDNVGVTLAFAATLGLIGAVDDVFDVGAKPKLALQLLFVAALWLRYHTPSVIPVGFDHWLLLPPWLMAVGLVLWSMVAINAVNFMDGSNGLIAGAMAIILGGVGLAGFEPGLGSPLSPLALFAAAACLGFLVWNFPRARLFQGDAGALFLGGLIAAMPLLGEGEPSIDRQTHLLTIPIALLPILTDVLLTLLMRARRRSSLLDAHKEHLYQRWLAAHGGNHAALAWRFWAITAGFTLAGLAASRWQDWAGVILTGAVVVAVCGWVWIDRSLRRRSQSEDSDPAFPPGATS
jgi:UDP-N-acetylmuramyl pentapeptide phosphotransferase/UDP-N-acetylglucosamine-1-phosphate transferase